MTNSDEKQASFVTHPAPYHHPPMQMNPLPQYQQHQQQYQPQHHHNYSKIVEHYEAANHQHVQNAFSTRLVVYHATFLLMLSIIFIALQIVLISNVGYGAFLAGGIWAGVMLMVTEIFTLSTLGCRNKCMVVASLTLHFVSMVFIFFGCFIIGAVALYYGPCYTYCENDVVYGAYTALVSLGGWSILQSIVFTVYIIAKLAQSRSVTVEIPYMPTNYVPAAPQAASAYNNGAF